MIFRQISNDTDVSRLQQDLDIISDWASRWQNGIQCL